MRKVIFLCMLLVLPFFGCGQIITTVAGNGLFADISSGIPATASSIGEPNACAFDKHGNLYFSCLAPSKVCKVDTRGIITVIAGTNLAGFNGDAILATNAQLYDPGGIAIDANGNIYIADAYNNRIRRVDAVSGIITTVAGNGSAGYSGDIGPATLAQLNGAQDICFDTSGNLYINDVGNARIRKMDHVSGVISTIAGNGTHGYAGDGGPAISAQIENVAGISVDRAGDVFFSQMVDARIRKVTASGMIYTIAGNGSTTTSGNGGSALLAGINPYRLAVDQADDIYFTEWTSCDIRQIGNSGLIQTIAGIGINGYSGDGGSATIAKIGTTFGIAIDSCNNVFIADGGNHRIRKITFAHCDNEAVPAIENEEVKIFPNPANDWLYIDNLTGTTGYQVTDMTGRAVSHGSTAAGTAVISLKGIKAGLYQLRLTDNNGNSCTTTIVKQ